MEKLKICMIGCGGMAGNHLANLTKFQDVEYLGFCDLIPEKAQRFAERAGEGRVYADFRRMLAAERPQLCYVCVPPDCHGEIEEEVVGRGIDIMVEKPVSRSIEQALHLRDLIEKKGVISSVGFQMRYETTMPTAKAFIAGNRVVAFGCSRVHGAPGQEWWRVKSRSGGQLVEQTIHQLDMLRYWLGEPETVFSVSRRGFVTDAELPGYDTDDVSVTTVRFESGVIGNITTGCYTLNGAAFAGMTQLSARDRRMEYQMGRCIKLVTPDGEELCESVGEPGVAADRTLLDAVRSRDASKIRSPYADGVKTLAFALACNRSMETGEPCKVAELLNKHD